MGNQEQCQPNKQLEMDGQSKFVKQPDGNNLNMPKEQ